MPDRSGHIFHIGVLQKIVSMKPLARFALLTITILGCIGSDQSTKAAAKSHLYGHASKSFIDGTFNLVYAENSGTMLGIGSTLSEESRFVLFVLFIGAFLVAAIAFVLFKSLSHLTVVASSLVVGGGISNLIDRLIHNGSVIDFMLIKMGSLESGIFNLADVAIILGTCLLGILLIRQKDKNR